MNNLVTVDATEIAKFYPIQEMIDIKNNILKGNISIVSEWDFDFWSKYADHLETGALLSIDSSKSSLIKLISGKSNPKHVILYSGGSESVLLANAWVGADLLHVKNLNEYESNGKRELTLIVIAMLLGYKSIFLGVSNLPGYLKTEKERSESFEYRDEFLRIINNTFNVNVQYPLTLTRKIDIYKQLYHLDLPFITCENVDPIYALHIDKKDNGCGKCHKCIEKYHYTQALGLPLPNIDREFLTQSINEMKQLVANNQRDPWGNVEQYMSLEKETGYTGWRE